MKKLTALLLAMLIAACLFACGQSEKAELYPDFTTCEPETITKTTEEATVAEETKVDNETSFAAETGTVAYYEEKYNECSEPDTQNDSNGGTLSYEEFYYMYYNMSDVTWEDCVNAAYSQLGMDEWNLRVSAGWVVREGYTWCDEYLAYLCAMCPLHYYCSGVNIGYGISGYGSDPSYYDESLADYGYGISQAEINLLYLAINYPNLNVFGCDGVSWYSDAYLIYSNWDGYYVINVWSY